LGFFMLLAYLKSETTFTCLRINKYTIIHIRLYQFLIGIHPHESA